MKCPILGPLLVALALLALTIVVRSPSGAFLAAHLTVCCLAGARALVDLLTRTL